MHKKLQMQKLLLIFSILVAGGLVYTESLAGQDSQDAEESLLPDIDPQDIEIRSNYRARFPGLRRQPILGFTPGSRVFQVDPDRLPFLEDYEEIAAQLPVDELSRPEAPEYVFFPYSDSGNGYGRIGLGSFVTPEADLYLNRQVGDNQWLSGSLNHTSGEGHLDQNSSFRFLDSEAAYRGKIGSNSVLGASVAVSSDFNYLPLLDHASLDDFYNPGQKSYSGLHAGSQFKRYRNSVEHFSAGIETSYNSISLAEESFNLASELLEWDVSADAGYTWAGGNIDEVYLLNADLQTGGYEFDDGGRQSWHLVGASGSYQRLFNYRTKLDAAIGLYHASDAFGDGVYVAPEISLDHYASDFFTFSASVEGKPEYSGQISHHRENRFLLPDNHLRHSYNLKATAQFILEPIANNKIRAGVSYLNGDNYAVYRRDDLAIANETIQGHYRIHYEDVTIPRVFAGINVDLIRERLWFDVDGFYQNPRISDEQNIPFTEEFGLQGAITIRPVDRLQFEAWGEYTGSRETDAGTVLDPFLQLGTKLEMKVADKVGVYGKILNLLNQEYEIWEGFTERPFQVYAGITLHL